MRSRPRRSSCATPRSGRHAAADQARHDHQRRVRADPARRPSIATRARWRVDAATAQREAHRPSRGELPRVGLRRGDDAARRSTPRSPRRAAAAATTSCPREAALDLQLARSHARHQRVRVRRAGPLRQSDRRVDASRCRRARSRCSLRRRTSVLRRRDAGRASTTCVPRPRRVHQGRVPRLRHRPRRAVVRAVDARGRAADDRGGRRHRAHRRADGGHAPHAAARPRQSRTRRATSRAWTCSRERYKVAALKTYTQWGPDGKGFFLDDDVGIAFIEKARKLGVRNIAVHKGLPFGRAVLRALDVRRRRPRRQALSRRQLPHLSLGLRRRQAGRAVRSGAHRRHRRAGARACSRTTSSPARNVYAELGSTWRFLMRDPDAAAHGTRQAPQVRRRGQRAVGHRLDLVRLAAGPDPGVPHVPDRRRAGRQARLSEA